MYACVTHVCLEPTEGRRGIQCVQVFFLHVLLCNTCVPGALREQKKGANPLELELEMAISNSVSAGNQTKVSARRVNTYNHLSCLQPLFQNQMSIFII